MELTIGTWNIWAFTDHDIEEMAEIIREEEIDILGLQETVIKQDDGSDEAHVSKRVADELGYHHYFCTAHDFSKTSFDTERNHKMGNAVLSKYPIKDQKCHSLNPESVEYDGTPEKEPRKLVETRIELGKETVSFFTTHLQYADKFKTTDLSRRQVENLLSVVQEAEPPIILTGDFNSPLGTEELNKIEDILNRVENERPTWTVHPFNYRGFEVEDLEFRLDHIFVSKDIRILDSETIYSELSDHLPVKAEIKVELVEQIKI